MIDQDHPTYCPECGKRALVRQSNNNYQCLSCRFNRDLSSYNSGDGLIWLVIIALVVTALLAGNFKGSKPSQSPRSSISVVQFSCGAAYSVKPIQSLFVRTREI